MKIEGRNSVYELLKTDKEIDKVMVLKDLKDEAGKRLLNVLKSRRIKIQTVDKFVIDKESVSKRSQGFIAFVSDYKYYELEDVLKECEGKDGFIVILNEVMDPHNLGSIIRVCECAGVDGLVIGKDRCASVSDTVMRVSEGALNHLKVCKVTNVNAAIDTLKENGFWVYGAESDGDSMYDADLTGKLCLVIGGEDSGVKKLTKSKCDKIISIPMFGKVNSLNASVACGVAVYEAVRQRLSGKNKARSKE